MRHRSPRHLTVGVPTLELRLAAHPAQPVLGTFQSIGGDLQDVGTLRRLRLKEPPLAFGDVVEREGNRLVAKVVAAGVDELFCGNRAQHARARDDVSDRERVAHTEQRTPSM